MTPVQAEGKGLTMDVSLLIHLEPSDDGSPVWWAESGELPGLTASADSLAELHSILEDVLVDLAVEAGQPIVIVSERLTGPETAAHTVGGPAVQQNGQMPSEAVLSPRTILVAVPVAA